MVQRVADLDFNCIMHTKMKSKPHRSNRRGWSGHNVQHERDLRDKLSAKEEENAVLLETLQRAELEKVVSSLKALTHEVRHLRNEMDAVSEQELRLKAMICGEEMKLEKMYNSIHQADASMMHRDRDDRVRALQTQKVKLLSKQNRLKQQVELFKKEMISQQQQVILLSEHDRLLMRHDDQSKQRREKRSNKQDSPARSLQDEIQRIKKRNNIRVRAPTRDHSDRPPKFEHQRLSAVETAPDFLELDCSLELGKLQRIYNM